VRHDDVVRIGLTREQVRQHRLQRFSIEVKPSDSRAETFMAEYGDCCWEVDVLPAAVIGQTLVAYIASRLDRAQWDRRLREIEANRALL
jgi:hypothetical protein